MVDLNTLGQNLDEFPSNSQSRIRGERWPSSVFCGCNDNIGIATTSSQMEAIGRLRYDFFIARDGKQYAHADHGRRLFLEPVDSVSLNFHALHKGRLLAAVRLTRAADAQCDRHLAPLIGACCADELPRTVLNTRLVVREEMSARAAIVPLFRQVYASGLASAAQYCLVATRGALTGIFERFGFQNTGLQFFDPVARTLHVMRLNLHQVDHLRTVRSPLLRIAEHAVRSLAPSEKCT